MLCPNLTPEGLAGMFDHTLLRPNAPRADFERVAGECRRWGFAMIAVNSAAVPLCRELLEGSPVHVGAAVSFPLGQTPLEVKLFEARTAIAQGADEIDYVTDLTLVKNGRWDSVRREMESMTALCREGGALCKVILETCYLTPEEIIRLCELAREIRPDFVKTSTGFGSAGATVEHVRLMKQSTGGAVRVKAAGGIRSLESCLAMIDAGAQRIGSSSSVAIMEEFLRQRRG
ncbi:MAG: deoxyribose-phosphate aldolase [Oscillospiraceae bacterium]|nr:deoxyribose-phosphate aldolase [Oscillospiraceae bacterium]